MRRRKQRDAYDVTLTSTVAGFKKGTDYQAAPAAQIEVDVPDALVGVPASTPSLADQLVIRAEQSRQAACAFATGDKTALLYIGDAILALTERLTELDR